MTSAIEDAKIVDIQDWKTLNTASSPTKLENGQTPALQNVWVDEKPGSVVTAKGYKLVGKLPSGNPGTFCLNYFKTSDGSQTFVVSDNSTVYTTTDFVNFTAIITGLSSAFQIRGIVARDKLWLTNGSDAVRVFDGSIVSLLDGTGGTPNVPRGRYIAYHDERVWLYQVPGGRSLAAFSALTDPSATIIAPDSFNAWPSSNTLQISEGDADIGTGLLLYRGYLHFFKQYSIWRLVGYDEYSYTRVKTRASTGTRFNESIQVLDDLVHYIGIDGIYVFDGEGTSRISDIIDPGTTENVAFGFSQLQQPNNSQEFWETSNFADWAAGASSANGFDIGGGGVSVAPFDSAQSTFDLGIYTNMRSDITGALQLDYQTSGHSSLNDLPGKLVQLVPGPGAALVGQDSYVNDGNDANVFGFNNTPSPSSEITCSGFNNKVPYSAIGFNNYSSPGGILFTLKVDGVVITPLSASPGVTFSGSGVIFPPSTNQNLSIIYPNFVVNTVLIMLSSFGSMAAPSNWSATEMLVITAAFKTSGQFVSRTLDFGETPNAYGNLNATDNLAGGAITFLTQSSSDGISWGVSTAIGAGGIIQSTVLRYLRYVVTMTTDVNGQTTPTISRVYLPANYRSVIHNTTGGIFAWGPFEISDAPAGQTIRYYYRAAATSLLVSSASWVAITAGAVINTPITNTFIQWKIEFASASDVFIPVVSSITANWTTGSGTQQSTLQNVCSFIWRNRYWLSAAGPGATANNLILIRGKKTFGSPWMLKDWAILSFCRFHDSFYGVSSVDGSIFLLDEGYNKAGAAMDSYFETGDFTFGGFYTNLYEVDVEVERLGTYNVLIGVSSDRGNTFTEIPVDLTPSAYAPSYIKRLNFNITTDRFRFRARINAADSPFQVHNLKAFYKLNVARGSIK